MESTLEPATKLENVSQFKVRCNDFLEELNEEGKEGKEGKEGEEKEGEKKEEGEDELRTFHSWDDLITNVSLLRGIYSYGFEQPSPIQSKAIHPIVSGRDVIAQAQSGTGKTGAFTIAALSKVDVAVSRPQVLILVPTRELADQITEVIDGLSKMMTGVRVKTVVGGSSIARDIQDMDANPPHIIVGCPGRVYDMIKRSHLATNALKLVVLDEADEMLSVGFKEQVYDIFSQLGKNVQIALFSATLPDNVCQITAKFMRAPIFISVKATSLTLEGIKQYFVALDGDREKYLVLKDLYQKFSVSQCIIYTNSVKRVAELYNAMVADEFPVCCIHSKMEQGERERVIREFKSGASRVLISSDVTSRGIDIQQVGVVINFDLPSDVHKYLHRIGRSGRWGRKGTGINFIMRRDVQKLKEIEQYYATQIDELPMEFTV